MLDTNKMVPPPNQAGTGKYFRCSTCGFSHGSENCIFVKSQRDVRIALDGVKPDQRQLREELVLKLRELADTGKEGKRRVP